ncbi:dihydrofolate reductase family protein [Cohnella kolymensis]|uniref:dihydrofolate reductase family protein n=1 Tax=Cohnella kolymensis TaxID=1590652 RepID=UPI0009E37DC0|nr:dihydrofolate reductase family protein [Cohnella kolymensis]
MCIVNGAEGYKTWNRSSLIKDSNSTPLRIAELKQQPGKDIAIFGSGTLVSLLAPLGLIDEYRLILNPVVLGIGRPLFRNFREKLSLQLVDSKAFNSGNILLCYR